VTVTEGNDSNLWIYDHARDTLTRLTFGGRNGWPVWSREGQALIYASNRTGTAWDVFRRPADGTAAEVLLLKKPLLQIPHSLSANDRLLALTEIDAFSFRTLLLSPDESRLRVVANNGWTPALSPDGRWVAYTSNETGRYEVYVRPTSGADAKWLISTDGGVEPVWSASGERTLLSPGRPDVGSHGSDGGWLRACQAPRIIRRALSRW
jgi:Tol biopolymer transport system component